MVRSSSFDVALRTTPAATLGALPEDLAKEASKRLGYYCLIWAALIAFWLVMNNFVGPLISPDAPLDDAFPIPANPVGALIILVSVALFLYTRWQACDCQLSLDLGLWYEIVIAFGIGVVNQWTPNTIGLSWICIVVLLHPMIVPNTSGKIVLAALVAASMDPLGIAITGWRGVSVPPFPVVLWTYLPNYICAILAVLPTQIFTRLGREVQDARELGSYHLGELLARGGMGEIYAAKHRMLRRPAAIKLIRRDAIAHGGESAETIITRFKREAKAAASLHSPHTIALYDFGVTKDGNFYYVMELLTGVDLEKLVQRFGPLPSSRVIYLLQQVCHSMAEAHARGMVHRDIKPANLYACRVGIEPDFVKVLDFGLVKSKATGGEDETKLTASNTAAGTPAYMAPELALGDEADHRADIYSLGCVAYWLLTGMDVFPGTQAIQVMLDHVNTRPARPSNRTELVVSSDFEEVVMACLEKEPANRPASAQDLSERLQQCAIGRPWTRENAEEWWTVNLPEFGVSTLDFAEVLS